MNFIKDWILSMTGAGTYCAIMLLMCPEGKIKKLVNILCGLIMTIALLSPFADIDLSSYAESIAKYKNLAESYSAKGYDISESLEQAIIEEESAAYIFEKAENMEIEISEVEVVAVWSDEGFWYPYEVHIVGEESAYLERIIETEFAVPTSQQYWEVW